MICISQRDAQILKLLTQGYDNDEISKELHMARRTVKAHFNKMFLKFGIMDGIKRVKLAVLACRLGIENADTGEGGLEYDERQVDRVRIHPFGSNPAGAGSCSC